MRHVRNLARDHLAGDRWVAGRPARRARAADLAARFSAALHVVHAWSLPPVAADSDLATAPGIRNAAYAYEAFERENRTLLDTETRNRGDRHARGRAHLCTGRPGSAIVALATDLHADLLVVTSQGLGPVRRLVLGSVSEDVVQHAPCPVLVLRGSGARPGHRPAW
ncbi:MAG: universal stress protein [Thermomicrobiales bacterium]